MTSQTQASDDGVNFEGSTVLYGTQDLEASALYATQINKLIRGKGDESMFKEPNSKTRYCYDNDGNEIYSESICSQSETEYASNVYCYSQAPLQDNYADGAALQTIQEGATEQESVQQSMLPLGREKRVKVLLQNN